MPRPLEFDRTKALENAMMTFWRQGYEATSLDDLTAAMKIRRPSLYNSFGDKQSLYLEALKHYQEQSAAQLKIIFEQGETVIEGFKAVFRSVTQSNDAYLGCMIVAASNELASTDKAVADVVATAGKGTEKLFANLIRQAQTKHQLDASLDANLTAAILYNSMVGLRSQARSGASLEKLEQTANAILAKVF